METTETEFIRFLFLFFFLSSALGSSFFSSASPRLQLFLRLQLSLPLPSAWVDSVHPPRPLPIQARLPGVSQLVSPVFPKRKLFNADKPLNDPSRRHRLEFRKAEVHQSGKVFKMGQPGIGDACLFKMQPTQTYALADLNKSASVIFVPLNLTRSID